MHRVKTVPRNNWQQSVEKLGFGFHTSDIPYWDESVYYTFTLDEILKIEMVSSELWEMCINAVQYILDQNILHLFRIPEFFRPYLIESWNDDHPSVYGRFDLCVRNGKIKLLEFNADTPTSLFEAGIVQWFWLKDFNDSKDQFNSIHEKLIERWRSVRHDLNPGILYFACMRDSLEDLTNTEYIRDCAMQAGIETEFIYISDIGWDSESAQFLDNLHRPILNLFKLYPWEFMIREKYGFSLYEKNMKLLLIEPIWKILLSNKAILPILWEMYPNHPNLLPAFFNKNEFSSYVKKPIFSREGANIEINVNNRTIIQTDGVYGDEGFIYQSLFELPNYDGNFPVVGSWIIGGEPAGIGIRESNSLITDNISRFVPHLML